MSRLDPAAEAFVRSRLGELAAITPVGTAGAAFRVEATEGRVTYIKAHRNPGKHARERFAYEQWAPDIDAATPALLAACDVPNVLLLEALPGGPTDDAPSTFELAGRALRSLHQLPVTQMDGLTIPEALCARARAWAHRAWPFVPKLASRIEARIGAVAHLTQGELRVPCHRDFEPRNWLMVETPRGLRLGVLDFEHARPDLWLADLARLAALFWVDRPDLEAAFWSGYGRRPSADEAEVLEALVEFEAGVTFVWGERHADRVFAGRGARTLARRGLALE